MKFALTLLCAASAAASSARDARELATDYTHGRTLRLERRTIVSQEVTELSMERDGEPVEHGDFTGRARTSECTLVWLDTVNEHADGAPLAVERVFETAELSLGEDGQSEESPLAGETVTLSLDEDGEVVAEADGIDDELLAGQRLTLPLDALLPPEEVEPGDSWELSGDALLEALGVEVAEALFPQPAPDPAGHGEGGPARRESSARLLRAAEWDASATWTGEEVEVDGLSALVIELALEGAGELEDEGPSGGGRERALGGPPAAAPALATDFEIRLEGRLLFSLEAGRPLSLEVEGTYSMESETTREMGGSVFTVNRSQEGTFEQSLTLALEEE